MITPPYLQKGDTVAIVATARKNVDDNLKPTIDLLHSWGLEVVIGSTIGLDLNQLAGTDEQRAADFQKQMADLKKNDNITVKEFNSRKEAIRKDHQQKMQSLLTAEQKSKLDKMKQDRMAKSKEMHARSMDKMKTQLNLSDDQVIKLKASHESFASKAKDIRSNQSLTQDQKKEQFKALAEQQKEETKSILTKEQLDKLQDMHKNRRTQSVK